MKRDTAGLLRARPISAKSICYIGKESDRRWEQGDDISILAETAQIYTPGETKKLIADSGLAADLRTFSIRIIAHRAKLSENTVKAARRGERLQRPTGDKLRIALNSLRTGSHSPTVDQHP